MKKTAIITGATGGLGNEFVKSICENKELDEIWAVGRNSEKLGILAGNDARIVAIEADLTDNGTEIIRQLLSEINPDVRMLINNAGTAYMGPFDDMDPVQVEKICRLNCSVPSVLMSYALPYMHEGAKIINISSASSFQPNPYLAMYSASKAYLKNLSRAVGAELKKRGITVTCVCPGWIDTEMLPRERDGKVIRYPGMISAGAVVGKALRDSARGRSMSVPGAFAKYFRLYSKLTPTDIVMKQWMMIMKKYVS
ncbi:MAG: SDR family NAD(P)-dependent oxidoreductase [Lachnospiraceae bacterium]|nr:SDR family NAD(P)-dependent oxidoreductase [Lachnospiraceae bacterium]